MSVGVTGSHVSDCLLSASDDSLSSSLALLSELSLANVMWSKGAEFFQKLDNKITEGSWACDSDHFHEKVVAKSKEYADTTRGERLLRAIGELQKLMDLAPRDLRTAYDLSEVADDIGMAAVNLLKQEKDSKFGGSDVCAMIEYQMTKIFGGLSIRMEELSATQQQSLVERVREFLQSLPADQQRFIMDKLGASDLSEAAIRRAIANGAMWTAFAAAVQVFGFAFYTTAAHLLAIVSLHLLPFGAYIGLSSTIAVLSSAWMLPIFAGFGVWYYTRKNRGLRQSMAPLIVTSLCLSGMEVQARTPSDRNDEALNLWAAARTMRDEKRAATKEARQVQKETQTLLAKTRDQLSMARATKESAVAQRNNLDQELTRGVIAAMSSIFSGNWCESLVIAAAKVHEVEARIARARQKRDAKKGFLASLGGYIEYGLGAVNLNGDLTSARAALVQQVKSSWPRDGSCYPPNTQAVLRGMDERVSEILAAEAEIRRLISLEREHSRQLDQASAKFAQADVARQASEACYHGLGTV